MADHCSLCERPKEPASEFCGFHNTAFTNLENAYSSWSEAYGGNLTKEEYFVKLEALAETGRTVKQIIQHLREMGAVD